MKNITITINQLRQLVPVDNTSTTTPPGLKFVDKDLIQLNFCSSFKIPLENTQCLSVADILNLDEFNRDFYLTQTQMVSHSLSKFTFLTIKEKLNSSKRLLFYYLANLNTFYVNISAMQQDRAGNWGYFLEDSYHKLMVDARLLPLFYLFELEDLIPPSRDPKMSKNLEFIHFNRRKYFNYLIYLKITPIEFHELLGFASVVNVGLIREYKYDRDYLIKLKVEDSISHLLIPHLGVKRDRISRAYSMYYFKYINFIQDLSLFPSEFHTDILSMLKTNVK